MAMVICLPLTVRVPALTGVANAASPRTSPLTSLVALSELPGATPAPADRQDTATGAATAKELTVSGLAPVLPTVTVRAALLPTAT